MEYLIYRGVELEIEFDYQPEEKQTWDYPGCGESFEITSIKINDIDVMELLEEQIESIEEALVEELKGRFQEPDDNRDDYDNCDDYNI